MTRWRKWRALSWADRGLLLRAAVMLLHAKLRLRSTHFRAEAGDDDVQEPHLQDESRVPRAQQVARLVGMASAGVPGAVTCLHRSLVTWRLLRQEGMPCRLRLGAADQSERSFEAHAWVECYGVALAERSEELKRYQPFSSAVVPFHQD